MRGTDWTEREYVYILGIVAPHEGREWRDVLERGLRRSNDPDPIWAVEGFESLIFEEGFQRLECPLRVGCDLYRVGVAQLVEELTEGGLFGGGDMAHGAGTASSWEGAPVVEGRLQDDGAYEGSEGRMTIHG